MASISTPVANAVWAATIVDELYASGVRTVNTSAGYRNAPLALAFGRHGGYQINTHIDERSGGFFALGMAKYSGLPSVLICTSGTAAANYLPAIIEAYNSNTPLIVLMADRPPELRQSGSNQTVDQVNLFGTHVRQFTDLAMPAPERISYLRGVLQQAYSVAVGSPGGPVHINIPLREPLTGATAEEISAAMPVAERVGATVSPRRWIVPDLSLLRDDLAKHRRGILLVGPMRPEAEFSAALLDLAMKTGYPIFAESSSLCRFDPTLAEQRIDHFDALLKHDSFYERFRPDVIVRFGARPVSKSIATAIAKSNASLYIINETAIYDDADYAATALYAAPIAETCRALAETTKVIEPDQKWRDELTAQNGAAERVIRRYLEPSAQLFEGHIAAAISKAIPEHGLLYVGNSMPVRDLDTYCQSTDRQTAINVLTNRGASGIDGMTSSALGAAVQSQQPTVLYLGDLSFIHDLTALATARHLNANLTIVVSNNDGGGIFSFLPLAQENDMFKDLFTVPHGLIFENVAKAFELGYARVDSPKALDSALQKFVAEPGVQIVEVTIDLEANVTIHREVDAAIAAAIGQIR